MNYKREPQLLRGFITSFQLWRNIKVDFEEAKAKALIEQMGQGPLQPSGGSVITEPVCPQCGLLHPPVRPDEKCPNAPIQIGEKKVDTTKFLIDLKNICTSQIEKKNIKDIEKMFKSLIVEITKFLENYKES